jgi:hypothetical protein
MDNEDLLRLQEQERSEVEGILLDSAVDMREFIAIRKGFRKVALHPDLPRDHMTAADYCRVRRGDRDVLGRRIK